MGRHDLSYRLFFTYSRMIQDLLLKIVAEPWCEQIDFDSAELVNTSFVSGGHESRDSDIVWKLRRKDGQEPSDLYVLVEFQSRLDPSMPVRFTCYESLFYQRKSSCRASACRRRRRISAWRRSKPCWLNESTGGTARSARKAGRKAGKKADRRAGKKAGRRAGKREKLSSCCVSSA
jgi:hypothetical protein